MQMLQAKNWYGVYLFVTVSEGETVRDNRPVERARLDVMVMPLIGWTSFEGGFQGLYYSEFERRLVTSTRLATEPMGNDARGKNVSAIHLGDIWEDGPPQLVRNYYINVLRKFMEFRGRYEKDYEVSYSPKAHDLHTKGMLPLPKTMTLADAGKE